MQAIVKKEAYQAEQEGITAQTFPFNIAAFLADATILLNQVAADRATRVKEQRVFAPGPANATLRGL